MTNTARRNLNNCCHKFSKIGYNANILFTYFFSNHLYLHFKNLFSFFFSFFYMKAYLFLQYSTSNITAEIYNPGTTSWRFRNSANTYRIVAYFFYYFVLFPLLFYSLAAPGLTLQSIYTLISAVTSPNPLATHKFCCSCFFFSPLFFSSPNFAE